MMFDLIGRPYRLGADGHGPEIDCIHLVYTALNRLRIPTLDFNVRWYDSSWRVVLQDLASWGTRVAQPEYDGDVVLLAHQKFVFGVTWASGILYINQDLAAASWHPVSALSVRRTYRHSSSLSSAN